MPDSPSRRRDCIFTLILVAVYLGIACLWQDISYFDETFYMDSGARFRPIALVHHLQFAPLYALWYRLLELICPWPVWRYFLSWGTMVAVAVLLPLWMRLRSGWLYAWLLVCVPFLGSSNLAIAPYVMTFAACILLVGGCIVRARCSTMRDAAFTATLTCFIVSFARPEFAFFVPVLAVAYFVAVRYFDPPLKSTSRARFQTCAVLAMACFMLLLLRHGGGTRSGVAFAQHFNVRASQNHLIRPDRDPWTSDYALQVFHIDTANTAANTTATISNFLIAKPTLFMAHVLSNFMSTLTWISFIILLFLLSVPFLPAAFVRGQQRDQRPMALYISLISLPSLTAILLVFPDQHYFFTLLPVVLLYATELTGTGPSIFRMQPWLLAAAAPVILLTTVGWESLRAHRLPLEHPVRDTVACLEKLPAVSAPFYGPIYESVGIAPVLFGKTRPHVEMWDIGGWNTFQTWVRSNRPAWVEIGPAVAKFYNISTGQIDTFLLEQGYLPHPCPAYPLFAPLNVYVPATGSRP